MDSDIVFDGMADDFADSIYGTSKGYIRLNVLWGDLIDAIPSLRSGNMRILDAGGGMGQIAIRLAELNHHVVLCDASQEMLDKADADIGARGLNGRIRTVRSRIQDLDRHDIGSFDLVLCHAVLEWLASPRDVLSQLLGCLKQNGLISLMFFNRNAEILKSALSGDFQAPCGYLDGEIQTGGFKEKSAPLDPEEVAHWLQDMGVQVIHKAGIRIFHDHIRDELRTGSRQEELLHMEKRFSTVEPFASLGQHIHLLGRIT